MRTATRLFTHAIALTALLVTVGGLPGCTRAKWNINPKLYSASDAAALLAARANGKMKYDSTCAGCHGPGETSRKGGADYNRIEHALQTIPFMQSLAPGLSDTDVRNIAAYLTGDRTPQTCDHPADVGHAALQRLDNLEFDNTLTDLLGITHRISRDLNFPEDVVTGNFVNNAKTLPVTTLLTQKYQDGAQAAMDLAFGDSALKSALLGCDASSAACVSTTLSAFLLRAFRRPPTAEEVARYSGFVSQAVAAGDSAETGVKLAMTAVLASPHFLFRIPRHSSPDNPAVVESLNSYELASRLSYFIWSSMPDSTLLAAAASGALLQDAGLVAQVQRMLKDPKAGALAESFAAQWLRLDKLALASPDAATFPGFSEAVRTSMKGETIAFLKDLFARDGSFHEIIASRSSQMDDKVAALYGIPGVPGPGFQKVAYPSSSDRIGVITHPSILTLTSHPTTTSIVRRGAWVLTNLLCSEPPPPPPGVTTQDATANTGGTTARDRLNQHLTNPQCAACHQAIDPIGFALESYDGIGKFRMTDNGITVDNTGVLDGQTFRGAVQLASLIDDSRFKTCASNMLFTYALGRLVAAGDVCTVNKIGLQSISQDKPISEAILALVKSDPFRQSRGDGGPQ